MFLIFHEMNIEDWTEAAADEEDMNYTDIFKALVSNMEYI